MVQLRFGTAVFVLLVAACGEEEGAARLPDAALLDAAPDAVPDGAPDAAAPVMAIDVDFEGALPPSITTSLGELTPSQDYAPLGPAGNTFGDTFLRGPTGAVVTVTLSDLPPHTSLSMPFLFAAIDSLDGSGTFPAGDYFVVTLDGAELFRETFANATPEQVQSYVGPPAGVLARRVDLGFGGPGGFFTDSAYDMGVEPRFQGIAHTGATATITFELQGGGVQPLDDESWAIDNLRVILAP